MYNKNVMKKNKLKLKNEEVNIVINPETVAEVREDEDNSDEFDPAYSISVSVRQLVEFILRTGDIDNRRTSGIQNAMSEGSRLHRKIQAKMGENYYPEVMLRLIYRASRFNICVEGRADGVITEKWDDNILLMEEKTSHLLTDRENTSDNQDLTNEKFVQITIDEIKTTSSQLEFLKMPVEVHLAQAKVYAYIYSKQKKLPFIRVRMSYCHVETEEMKYFIYEYSYGELSEWFETVMESYLKWADFQYDWRLLRQDSIKKLEFPFEYRDGQRQLAVYVYRTILQKKKLFLEAPTGTGKTIATCFPAVKSMGEDLNEKIFYLTAKSVTAGVAEEAFSLMREKGLHLKSVTITAKDKICPFEEADCNPTVCNRAKGHYDRVNDALYDMIVNYDSIDKEIITRMSEKYEVCPFELSLDASIFADAIIGDYNYVFDPHVSLKRYFAEGTKGNYTFLVDESHNLVDRGREMYSAVLKKEDILGLKKLINDELDKQKIKKTFKNPSLAMRLIRGLERCNKEMLALKKISDGCVIHEDIDRLAGLTESLRTVMEQFLEDENEHPYKKETLEFYFEICHFLMIYEKLDSHYVIYSSMLPDHSFIVKLFCVDPSLNLKECMERGRSSILFSATLLPIQYYKNLLGGDKDDYEAYADSVFDSSKRGIFVASDVTSKYTRRNSLEYNRIAEYIYETINVKKGNYMVFFPSYAFLADVYKEFSDNFLDKNQMVCVLQQEYMNDETRKEFIGMFSDNNTGKSLVGFCVLGGIFSEGIDLKNDSLIGSIIVGVGLPMVCDERELLKDHFDDENAVGFDYSYRYPGMNKVLQAAGRVIRTTKDIGVVLLLDERFLQPSYRKLFPREWDNVKRVDVRSIVGNLKEFWSKQK